HKPISPCSETPALAHGAGGAHNGRPKGVRMSNGYLLAAEADIDGVREIAAGFGLEAIGANTLGGQDATVAALANAANVGIVLSQGATRDAAFVALLLALSNSLHAAQLILAAPDARSAFPFLPASWP